MSKSKIVVARESMFDTDVDAIVNAANEHLRHGGGVAKAIANAGGWRVTAESKQYIAEHGPLPTGQACSTTAGDLPFKAVIHTPGPVWHGGDQGERQLLAASHRSVIAHAAELGFRSVAFPAISCGIFGFPVELAAPIAIGATDQALGEFPSIEEVRFSLIDETHYRLFLKAHEALS